MWLLTYTGFPKKWLSECCWSPKISKPNWVLQGQIFPWTWVWGAWSCPALVKKRPKMINFRQRLVQVWLRGVPATGDWAGAQWLQQHSESRFFGTPCIKRCHCTKKKEDFKFVIPLPWSNNVSTHSLLKNSNISYSVNWSREIAEYHQQSQSPCIPLPPHPSWCSYNKVKPRGSSDISATLHLFLLQTLSFVGWLTCMSSWLFHNSLQTAGRKLSCRPKCYIGGSSADACFLLVDAWICCVPIGRRHRSTVQWLACRHMLAFLTIFKMDF